MHYVRCVRERGRLQEGGFRQCRVGVLGGVSGAGKFTDEAKHSGPVLISRMVKLHYNWKYIFLRPTVKQVIERYNKN